jgi:fibronectin-binding autotransporter adhesin
VSVASGATLSGLAIGGGNTSVTVDIASGGIVSGGVIGTNGTLNVSGGTASGVTISSGGTENVVLGGVDSGANITDGGVMIVSSGGTAISGFILDPGSQVVSSGATASGYVASGGTQFVFGTAISTLVESGVDSGGTFSGLQVVESSGFASATILSGGGVQSVKRLYHRRLRVAERGRHRHQYDRRERRRYGRAQRRPGVFHDDLGQRH